MPETGTSWPDLVQRAEDVDLMAMKLWQIKLERDGVMFAAGPLADDQEAFWEGEGIFVYRAVGDRDRRTEIGERVKLANCTGAQR